MYKVIWRKRFEHGNSFWRLDRGQSVEKHDVNCTSTPKLRTEQLVHRENFARSIVNDKSINIKTLHRAALSPGTVTKAVSKDTLYRAKNKVLEITATDYLENWHKLAPWGIDFLDMNPGSMFDLEADDEGR